MLGGINMLKAEELAGKNNLVHARVLTFYLILAPINWLPFLPIGPFNLAKIILFILLFFGVALQGLSFPTKFLSPRGFLLVIFLASYAFVFAEGRQLNSFKEVLLPFLMVWLIYNIDLDLETILDSLYKAARVLGVICVLSFVSAVTGVFDLAAPDPWDNSSFSESAFAGYRTGWSNSMFLYVPLLFLRIHLVKNRSMDFWTLFTLGSIILSQIMCAGRAGLLAAVLTIFIFNLRNVRVLFLLGIAVIVVFQSIPAETILEHFRASGETVEDYDEGFDRVNRISSNRLDGYIVGWEYFLESPVFGHGFGAGDELRGVYGFQAEIHNVWIKRLVDGGLLYVLPLFFIFVHIAASAFGKHSKVKDPRDQSLIRKFTASLLFPSFVITFLEPNYLIGSFQGEAFFWACIGMVLRFVKDESWNISMGAHST